jgi:hypothetical protein
MITWQELSEVLSRKLRLFLEDKYGICARGFPAAISQESQCS